tara:strand:+ start:11102 stop:11866 length:765 start_codon:yes stop_codon:yes gene_type:complete
LTNCAALFLAAGKGKRFSPVKPKQYMSIDQNTVLWHSLLRIGSNNKINTICVVIDKSDKNLFEDTKSKLPLKISEKFTSHTYGGLTRQESSFNGLKHLNKLEPPPDLVFIHDAARPFVPKSAINELILSLKKNSGALLATQCIDTIKKAHDLEDANINSNLIINNTLDRNNLWLAQTPQAFIFSEILDAHQKYKNKNFTDDSALAERAGLKVAIIESESSNFKITTQKDLELARIQLKFELSLNSNEQGINEES